MQVEADRARGPVPVFSTTAEGEAALESFTVIYDREGAPSHGAVIARVGAERVLARVPADDDDGIARLTDLTVSPIGATGHITAAGDELRWAF